MLILILIIFGDLEPVIYRLADDMLALSTVAYPISKLKHHILLISTSTNTTLEVYFDLNDHLGAGRDLSPELYSAWQNEPLAVPCSKLHMSVTRPIGPTVVHH